MDTRTHARYLDYRERHGYFGHDKPVLSAPDFARFDAELRGLEASAEGERSDEDEARLVELRMLLFRD